MSSKINRGYGISNPLGKIFPQPVIASRAPTTGDKKHPLGQVWVRTDTNQAWTLTSVSAGSATWSLSSPGSSDVDTLTGDSGGAISPTAGNITLEGGTNITSVGSGSTITFNLDAEITIATSVTSPLYTAAAASDVAVSAPSGQDVVIKVGDNGGTNKLSIIDSDDAEVASIDSNGGLSVVSFNITGLLTAPASATINTAGTALNLATDNSGDAVNIGNGSVARAITIGSGAAHTVNIGTGSAGAIAIDSGAGISLDGAAASNFSVSGAGIDLTLASAGGRVVMNGEEAAADALRLLSAAGGLDVDVALQMSLVSSQNAADAIIINASAGGIDVTAAGAAGEDLDLACTAGSTNISAGEAAADAITIQAASGGIDVDGALQVNIASSQNAASALVLSASAGGIDITAAGAAGEDIDISNSGSVNITSTEAVADAIVLNASDAAGGIDILTGGGALDVSAGAVNIDGSGQVQINSSASTIDIGNDAVAQNINIGTGAAARTVTVGNTTGASALVLQSGTGEITVTGTVKEINAKFLYANGTDLVVTQSPIMQSAATTGAAPTGTNGDVNLMYLQDGCLMEQFIIGTQTIIAPRMTANGLNIALDNTNAEGAEYNFGALANAKHTYTIGTDAAFFAEATFYVEDLSGCAPLMMGFRKVEANNSTLASYTDYACIGLNQATSATNVVILDELNGGGQTATNTTDAWGGDLGTQKVGIFVSAAGVVTFQVNGSAASAAPSYTFDNADNVMFFIHFLNGADVAGEVSLVDLKIGYQA